MVGCILRQACSNLSSLLLGMMAFRAVMAVVVVASAEVAEVEDWVVVHDSSEGRYRPVKHPQSQRETDVSTGLEWI